RGRVAISLPRKRKRHLDSKVRFSPIDFLRLLPEPFSRSDISLGSYARQLAFRRQRLERLIARAVAKGFVIAPERVDAPQPGETQDVSDATATAEVERIQSLCQRSSTNASPTIAADTQGPRTATAQNY